jgi:REP-associated tyrosine transposase
MVLYRRNRLPGSTYFFTMTLTDRGSDRLVRHIGLLREAFRVARRGRPFHIDAIVVLPDHLHTVWTLPADDADYSGQWRHIKADFSRQVAAVDTIHKNRRSEYRLWQSRYWEHTTRNDTILARHPQDQIFRRWSQQLDQGGHDTDGNDYHAAQADDQAVFQFLQAFVQVLPAHELLIHQFSDDAGLYLGLFLGKTHRPKLLDVLVGVERYRVAHEAPPVTSIPRCGRPQVRRGNPQLKLRGDNAR